MGANYSFAVAVALTIFLCGILLYW